jgi:ribosome-associated protein
MAKKNSKDATIDQIRGCCEALNDRKAEHIRVLDLNGKSSVTDYFVIASATSEPHLRALRRSVEGAIKELGISVLGVDAATGTGWFVIDAFDFMIHLFLPEVRDIYRIESLWKDATEIPLGEGSGEPMREEANPLSSGS